MILAGLGFGAGLGATEEEVEKDGHGVPCPYGFA
jgi:hypothetical protein